MNDYSETNEGIANITMDDYDALEIMDKIEESIIENIKQLNNYKTSYNVDHLEKKTRQEKKQAAAQKKIKDLHELNKLRKQAYIKRKGQRVQEIWKKDAQRSSRPIPKKKDTKPPVDPDQLDFVTYLGY